VGGERVGVHARIGHVAVTHHRQLDRRRQLQTRFGVVPQPSDRPLRYRIFATATLCSCPMRMPKSV
jgi:hypothetical protein